MWVQVVAGGGRSCGDFGLGVLGGRFVAMYSPPGNTCGARLQGPAYRAGHWHLLAAACNGTHLSLYVDSTFQAQAQVSVTPFS